MVKIKDFTLAPKNRGLYARLGIHWAIRPCLERN